MNVQKTYSTVTIPEGIVRRQYEQTASRDHDVALVAGAYPMKPDTSPEGYLRGYWVSVPAIAHEHYYSTAEFGGMCYAGEMRGGETETHGLFIRSYEVEKYGDRGYVFS